jgi:hypothetical protein
MRKLLTFLIALGAIAFGVCSPAGADGVSFPGMPPQIRLAGSMSLLGVGRAVSFPPSYQGVGDVFAGAAGYWSVARVYSSAQATTSTNMADLVATGTTTPVLCTLRGSSTGFVDLSAYCTGSVTPASACSGGCSVVKLYDQTGNGYDLSQSTAANLPSLSFNSSPTGSLPSMRCTAASCILTSTATFTATAFTVAGVYERTNTAAGYLLQASSALVGVGFGSANQAIVSNATVVGATAAANDNSWNAIQGLIAAGACALDVNGTDQTGMACGSTGVPLAATLRFVRSGSGMQPTGFFAEIALWLSSTTTANRQAINSNQHGTSGYNF